MNVLLLEPGKKPRPAEITLDLPSMQKIVGGYIQAVYPFDDPVALICNDEGKLLNLPFTLPLRTPGTGEIYDVVAGTCFLCGAPPNGEHFTGLTKEQLDRYLSLFLIEFALTGGDI